MFEEESRKYLDNISEGYEKYKKLWIKYFQEKNVIFSEDIFNDTILKCYELIKNKGIKDSSFEGCWNYTFMAFNMNTRRESLYARNQYLDENVDVFDYLDKFENGENDLENKINLQHLNDYSTTYLLKKLEKNTDLITFSCFRLYYLLPKMTYHKLKEITNVKDCKKRVLEARDWLKNNVTEQEILNAFKKYQESI